MFFCDLLLGARRQKRGCKGKTEGLKRQTKRSDSKSKAEQQPSDTECKKERGGVAGVRGTAPEPEWGPRGEIRGMENIGSECNFDKQLAIICRGFLSLSIVSMRRFGSWSAKSGLLIGIFLRIKILISRPIFEGPSADNPRTKQWISELAWFASFVRFGRERRSRPDLAFTRASPGLRQ